jgi:hypothetical protein
MHSIHGWLRRLPTLAPSVRTAARSLLQSLCMPVPRVRLVCMAVLLISVALLIEAKSAHRVLLLDFGPTNGTFQCYNPLRRIDAGQVMFRDFYPYIGAGPTVTSYLAFRLEGRDFRSSIHALEVLAGILHLAALVMLARLCRLSWFWSIAVAATLVFVGARFCPTIEEAYLPRTDFWAATIHGLFFMSQSGIAVRSAAPILVCLFVLMRNRISSSPATGWRQWLFDGIAAGLALVWSNDYGLPTSAAFTVLFSLLAPGVRWPDRLKRFASTAVTGLLVAAIALTIATAGRPWNWFQYNAGVAADQFWYYEGRKILRLSEIPLPAWAVVGLVTGGFLVIDVWRRPQSLGTRCMLFLLTAQFAAGYLSSIGGHIENHYFTAAQRTLTIAAPFAVVRMLVAVAAALPAWRRSTLRFAGWLQSRTRWQWALVAVQVTLTIYAGREAYHVYRNHLRYDRLPAHNIHVAEMGGHLGEPWSKLVQIAREIRETPLGPGEKCRLFSTYATALETVSGEFHPTGHDYIIHGLGVRERERYLAAFRELRPKHPVTLRRDVWPWERWAQCMHWDFYRELFRDYEPFDRCLFHVVWQRRQSPLQFESHPVHVRAETVSPAEIMLTIELPANENLRNEAHYVEIEVEAAGHWSTTRFWNGSWRQRLSVVDPTKLRHSFTERFAVPLQRRSAFPALVRPGEPVRLLLELAPEEHSRLELTHLSARYILPSSVVDDFPLSRLRASAVDSSPWRHGVRSVSDELSIVCVSDPSDLKHLRPGQRLRFAHSGEREVTKIDFNHIYLAGPPLDPDRDGYPAAIQVER